MGDGGKTIPVANNLRTVTVKANIPNNCYPTGVTYACNKPQVQQPAQPQASQPSCRPCNDSIGTKIGRFFGNIGRCLYNTGAVLFKGTGNLLCGTANFIGNVLSGIGNGLNRFGAAFNNATAMPYYQPTQIMYTQPSTTFAYSSPPAYPFSMTGSCFPTMAYNNNGFMSGMLFGAMLNNNRHHHCHSHISRPLIINRHIGFGRPFGRHWGCC